MKTKKILTTIVFLGFSLTAMGMGLWAGTAGLLPGASAYQEKTEKEEEEKQEGKNKKEEEKDKKVKRVWTDEDLKKIKNERLNITEVTPEPGEKKEEENKENKEVVNPPELVKNTTEGEKYDPTKTEKYWRERKNALVEKINANEAEVKNMQAKLFQMQNQLNGTDIVADRIRLEKEIRDTADNLENYKKGLERMKQELEDLEDEARKAGVPPGWVRD